MINIEDQNFLFGLAVVSEQAAAIGVTAVPTPDVDSDSDLWFVFETLMGSIQVVAADDGVSECCGHAIIDSKAMRKVEPGQTIVQVGETPTNTDGLVFTRFTRMLIKLH